MAKKEHRFNPQTLTYEVITAPFRLRTYRLLRKILIGFILISVVNALFSYFFYTPKMYRINRSNRELVMKYRIMQDRLNASERKMAEIRHRDQSSIGRSSRPTRSRSTASTPNTPAKNTVRWPTTVTRR